PVLEARSNARDATSAESSFASGLRAKNGRSLKRSRGSRLARNGAASACLGRAKRAAAQPEKKAAISASGRSPKRKRPGFRAPTISAAAKGGMESRPSSSASRAANERD